MAGAIITLDGTRGHLRAIQMAGAASMLLGVTSSWAQQAYPGTELPFCEVYPRGAAPAIGPSNCTPIPPASWDTAPSDPDAVAKSDQANAPASPRPPLVEVRGGQPVGKQVSSSASPPDTALAVRPPGPLAPISLQTPGAVTLEQLAALLGPVSKRTVTFTLSPSDEYKKDDQTHRVRLTYSGPLQALVDQLAEVYGLDAAVDDTAIRFISRKSGVSGSPTTRTPSDRT